ncbi:MAG: T9SS type A sorting domain-containing protein [Bacteroidales bacterium]|nr:T9SS type A sorting domain-containing protein [Bacteroidales bacterium]
MKNILLSILFTISITALLADSGYEVNFNQPETGTYELQFDLGDYDLTTFTSEGETFTKIVFDGSVNTNKKGFAELPFLHASVQLSAEKNVTLKVIEGDYVEYTVTNPMLPSRGVIYRDQDPSTIPYEIAPSSIRDNWYPQNFATNTSPFIVRDLRGTTVYVFPFRYNAVQQVLRVYENITVQLVENTTPPVNPLAQKATVVEREMDPIYQSLFINYNTAKDLTIGDYGEILILCTSRDETAMEPYIEWKREKGFKVYAETVSTGTNVKTTIQNAYANNNNLLYVQLVGDWADIKSDLLSGYAPMDPQLGCVVGSDQQPDIAIGRFSGNSAAQIAVQVNKVIEYEKNPEMGADWYSSALGVASNQGPGDDNELDYEQINVIYNDKLDPFTYDNFSTAYDPTGNAQMVSNALNSGVSIINYCGHGSETSWGSTGFSNSHINSLSNGNMLPVIFSVACVNGAFHSSGDCFAEAWLKKENGGAVMTMMSTINQPWDPPMRGQDYFNDILIGGYDYTAHPGQNGISTTEGRTTIGAITFNGLVLMTTESGSSSDWETAKTWHIFGDPSMQPRTIAPYDLNMSGNVILVGAPFTTTITGPNGPVEGAMVCLSQNGEYFSAITDAAGSVSMTHTLSPGTAKLVVTGFNTETIYEDVTVVPPGGAYVIVNGSEVDDTNGNNNGQADYGETVALTVTAENVGSDPATGVEATISTSDDYVTITNDTYTFGTIAAGATMTGNAAFEIEVAEDAPDGHTAIIDVEFADDSKASWLSSITVTLHAAVIELGEYTINDNTGNNNGKIDPGETVFLTIEIMNEGSSDAYDIEAELSSSDPYITINGASQFYGDIDAGGMGTQTFSVSANIGTPAGQIVTFNMDMTGDMGLSASGSFTEVVGQIPILIIDLDGNQNSSDAMQDALANNDFVAEYMTSFPADLELYTSVFLCLGVYSDNSALSQSEGQALADYLNNGGNLYMEGGDTWYYDEQTPVHGMFGVNATADGSSDLGTLNGQDGTFTEGMSFGYSGDNNWIDHIEPVGGSFKILQNQSPPYGSAIANDNGTYKTIAASHEFGGLTDGDATTDELMQAYLAFFGFTNTLNAMFSSNMVEVCEESTVEFYDMSSGDVVSWNWTFEGGYPATSTEQNPEVMYSSDGNYDVTLEVSDGTETVSLTLENYITVMTSPEQASTPTGESEACTNYGMTYEYSTTGALYADTYEWTISPADAGTISGSGMTAEVEWTTEWEGTATITVTAMNDCGTGTVSEGFDVMCSICTGINENNFEDISVYPNPNSGIFTVEFSTVLKDNVTIKVLNTLGKVIYSEENLESTGNFSKTLDLSNFDKGLYFLVLENYRGNTVNRIIIR